MRRLSAVSYALAVLLVGTVPAARADYIVLQSGSTNFSEGQLIQDPAVIELPVNERLVLLSDGGDVIDVQGPFRGVPSGSRPEEFDLKTAFSNLINNPDNVHASLGSTRSAGIVDSTNEDRPAWTLNPFESGAQCIPGSASIHFWRADAARELELEVQRPGHTGSGGISWAAGETLAQWPETVPVVDQELYVVRRRGWMENAMIRLAVIPATIADEPRSAIGWLAINGCRSQARLLLQIL